MPNPSSEKRILATEQALQALDTAVAGLQRAAATFEYALEHAAKTLPDRTPAGSSIEDRIALSIIDRGPHYALEHAAKTLPDRAPAASSIEERIALKEARLDAAKMIFGEDRLHAHAARNQLEALRSLLDAFTEPAASRLRQCLESIANPTPESLEAAGVFCRKAALLGQHPGIYAEASNLTFERYGLEEMYSPAFNRKWDIQTGKLQQHPVLKPDFFEHENQAAGRYDSMLKIAMLLDPDVRAIVDRVPLPEETPERIEARKRLAEKNCLTFGRDTMTHRNGSGFTGGVLLTQRAFDEMGFSGQLDVRMGGRVELQGTFCERANWNSLPELQAIAERDEPRALRIMQALQTASLKNGFHVVGEFFDNCGRDLIGLDDAVYWSIDSLPFGRPEYYGSHKVTLRIDQMPDAIVSLGDDVMVNWNTRPEAAVQYANGLVSLNQFRELVLDSVSFDAAGNPLWEPPQFGVFLTDDTRYELQTRGCIVLPEGLSR